MGRNLPQSEKSTAPAGEGTPKPPRGCGSPPRAHSGSAGQETSYPRSEVGRERREEASQPARQEGEGGGGPGAHFVLGLRTSAPSPRPRNLHEACSHAPSRGPASRTRARPRRVAPARFVPPNSPAAPQARRYRPSLAAAPRAQSLTFAPASSLNPPRRASASSASPPTRASPSPPSGQEPPHPSRPRVRPRPSAQHPQPQSARPVWTVPPGKQMHQRVPLGHSLSRMSSGR